MEPSVLPSLPAILIIAVLRAHCSWSYHAALLAPSNSDTHSLEHTQYFPPPLRATAYRVAFYSNALCIPVARRKIQTLPWLPLSLAVSRRLVGPPNAFHTNGSPASRAHRTAGWLDPLLLLRTRCCVIPPVFPTVNEICGHGIVLQNFAHEPKEVRDGWSSWW